jgi:hypothetical protein
MLTIYECKLIGDHIKCANRVYISAMKDGCYLYLCANLHHPACDCKYAYYLDLGERDL